MCIYYALFGNLLQRMYIRICNYFKEDYTLCGDDKPRVGQNNSVTPVIRIRRFLEW